ncbi:MAG: ribosome maturation factor RimM [Candidatus Neomarinimicrobiota bacterium]
MLKLFAIAKITKPSGFSGDVRVRPLVRHFDDYIQDKDLSLGFSEDLAQTVKLMKTTGLGKSKRFLFEGIGSREEAETIIGQTLFAVVSDNDPINLISPDLLGAAVVTSNGDYVGELVDMLSLPTNDVYVIENGKKEVLIPVVPEIITHIGVKEGVVTIEPMDGLLD